MPILKDKIVNCLILEWNLNSIIKWLVCYQQQKNPTKQNTPNQTNKTKPNKSTKQTNKQKHPLTHIHTQKT